MLYREMIARKQVDRFGLMPSFFPQVKHIPRAERSDQEAAAVGIERDPGYRL
jgi:hypothetical protein